MTFLDFTPPGQAARTGRLVLGAIVAVVLLIGAVVLIQWLADPLGLSKRRVENARSEAAVAAGEAVVSAGQAAAQSDASGVLERSVQRYETTRTIHEENTRVIQSAPGAGDPLPDGFVDALNGGLCRYASTDDPGCAELRRADPE